MDPKGATIRAHPLRNECISDLHRQAGCYIKSKLTKDHRGHEKIQTGGGRDPPTHRRGGVQPVSGENGIDGTAVADLMSQAGLTLTAILQTFHIEGTRSTGPSLQLAGWSLRESMEASLSRSTGRPRSECGNQPLSFSGHRDDPGSGCPFVALAGELARSSDEVRDAATEGVVNLVNLIAKSRLTELPTRCGKEEGACHAINHDGRTYDGA